MMLLWLAGLLRRQPARLLGAALGVATTVAMLACLGTFLTQSQATMTARAVRGVAVDWQVQVQPDTDPKAIAQLVGATPGVRLSTPVGFAQTTGLSALTGDTTQTTGPGVVLGLPADYPALFPGQIRRLVGADSGVLLAQQTAANLHVTLGDIVTVGRADLSSFPVTVAGIVDLPQANSLFQKVGAPPGSQPAAPPDNVLILPEAQWHAMFDPLATRTDLVSTQIHVLRDHVLPSSPAVAYSTATAAARNLEARSGGGATVADNLGAALAAARSDAAYAQILFLFLGVPGAILAAAITSTVAAASADRRRREQALLRARGASARQLLRLAAAEAGLIGTAGALLGLLAAAGTGYLAFGSMRFGATTSAAVGWSAAAAATGVALTVVTVLLPARRDLLGTTVATGRAVVTAPRYPAWARYGLDALALLGAWLVFAAAGRSGYQLVLAPEGVPTISVSYWALAGPGLLWVGAALLTWRLGDLILGRGRRVIARLLRPMTGPPATIIANGLSRQRRPLIRAIVLLALALAFAASTATFNATYSRQAEADAQLTNGADVSVTPVPGTALSPEAVAALAQVPGVASVEPLQHRFAYIGADMQDLFGVRPDTVGRVSALQDSYFPGSTATDAMAVLAAKPDSILVSAETVKDFRLRPGDPITLRLTDSGNHQPKKIEFHYAGVVAEFPTAPKDSFFVANATYVAQQTGSDAIGTFLLDTHGVSTTAVAEHLRAQLGVSATVTDIATVRGTVGSSLTSIDLTGLTRVELSFAALLAVCAGGLVLALGLAERRRTFAVLTALGATPRQLRDVVFSEAAALTAGGLIAGAATGSVLSLMLVKILTGVFDPPPSSIAVPWAYLLTVLVLTVTALAVVSALTARAAQRPAIAILREL
ncbi:ABC transporter permease [Nocardia acidivorans]|uniref:ABC transporter permease n=1 Tax=Nocardia acidivorans TaxID=404580 RepID=UPI00082FFE01|nr:ABC transporter permease [Nocardia acidivorans]